MPPSFTWQALSGQGWPATQEQERMFVEALRRAAAPAAISARSEVTCFLNALRCGVTFDDLIAFLPGASPDQMLHGYLHLHDELRSALTAWKAITADPCTETIAAHGANAARLLPVPVHRVTTVVAAAQSPQTVSRAVQVVVDNIAYVTAQARELEATLTTLHPGDPAGIRLGAELHNIAEPALWSDEYFLPRRVGELSPARAADLRGDPR